MCGTLKVCSRRMRCRAARVASFSPRNVHVCLPQCTAPEMTGNGVLHSHSVLFPYSSLTPFPHGISIALFPFPHTRRKMQTVDSRAIKTVPRKTGHQSLNNKNSKNTIHNTLKIRQKFHLSKHYVS